MKTLLLCNSDILAIPAAMRMHTEGNLVAIGIPEKSASSLLPILKTTGIDERKIHVLQKKQLEEQLLQLIENSRADIVFTMTFPWKLPSTVLNKPANGCINFHFGLLPKYKGADPIFWQLRNMEQTGGIAVHVMTEDVDAGPIILQKEIPIIPGETYGLFSQRLGFLATESLTEVTTKLATINPYEETEASPPLFWQTPTQTQLRIDWNSQSAAEIEWMINAANPKYVGASTSFRQNGIYLVEVSPADVNNATPVQPGTIVYADALYGVIVQCINNEFLKINVARMNEGFMSGTKLFNLGFKTGEAFI